MPAHGDKSIWGIFIILCIISVIELYSASSREVKYGGVNDPIMNHVMYLGVGFLIVWVLEKIHYRWFFGLAYAIAFISGACMIYMFFKGQNLNGAVRSISMGPVSFQPSELLKISAVLVIARIMACSQKAKGVGVRNKAIVICAGIVLVFGAMLYPEGLTNTALLMSISLCMMLLGGTEFKKMALVVLVYALIGGGAKAVFSTKRDNLREDRIAAYNPFRDKYNDEVTASNLQEMHSYMAQANGHIFGVFPGNSRETTRLPLAFSDYIYAIVVEDTGFVGGIFVMLLYLTLLARAGIIARKCHRAFPTLLVMGMAVMIVTQALFHMAITTGAAPVSGQPLPLISQGGSSIIITCVAFGVMLSVSRSAVQNGTRKEVKEELDRLPEELRAENPVQI